MALSFTALAKQQNILTKLPDALTSYFVLLVNPYSLGDLRLETRVT